MPNQNSQESQNEEQLVLDRLSKEAEQREEKIAQEGAAQCKSVLGPEFDHILESLFKQNFESDNQQSEIRNLRRIGYLKNIGPRSFYNLLDQKGFNQLEKKLHSDHPAMSNVIEFLLDELALGSAQSNPSPRPILLVGPPGCGKTYFANALAEELSAPFFTMSIATADSSFQLTGTNSTWGQAKPSGLIKKIAETNARAGVMFFDEVTSNKNDSERNFPVLPALLEVLDLEQSRQFKDLFFDYPMDISAWIKILACNTLDGLSPAIVDRCQLIHIERPNSVQQLQIIERIASTMPVTFSSTGLDALNNTGQSLRQIGADIRRLAGQAIRKNQCEVHEIDVKRLAVSKLKLLESSEVNENKRIMH